MPTPTVADILQSLDYGPAPESAGLAQQWLESHQRRFGLFINGAWTPPDEQRLATTTNPANGAQLAQVTIASSDEIDAAVAAARQAFPTWSQAPGHVRARYLYALARQVQKHARLLSVLEALDNGKPIRETRDIDIPLVARHFYYHAGWAQLRDSQMPGYGPVGVCGQIVPWNFPMLMLAWKIAPALAAGCTVVLKPASWTPLTALAFAEICERAALPPGVVNIITGNSSVGAQLVRHPGVDKIAFTGSTEVGRDIRLATAGSGKALSLELGGKSPFIVFESADLDGAVEGVVDAIWFNQGQVCCAGSRLLVQESVAPQIERKLRERMQHLRVGNQLDKAIDMGAIVSPQQLSQIEALVQQGRDEGADIWQPSWARPSEGSFYPPTLCTNVAPAATIAQEEIFGPVLVMLTFRTPAEAVQLANNTRYGLAASVWSEDLNVALDTARQLKAGVVWVNSTNLFDAAAGFGGYRESGFGREGGREGMFEYLKPSSQIADVSSQSEAETTASPLAATQNSKLKTQNSEGHSTFPHIDRTPKLYIGGKQTRPDSGYTRAVHNPDGLLIGEVGEGNRKDLRNAVEAARAASAWANQTAHGRAQVLYYLAENLAARAAEFAHRLHTMTGESMQSAQNEVEASIECLFSYAAWADKYDGAVHHTPLRNVTIAMPEAIGVIGIVCPEEKPLLGAIAMLAPAIAMGNAIILVPSERYPLAATDLYQVLDTSDVPGGVVNIVTGERDVLAKTLAEHMDVDVIWYTGPQSGRSMVETASAGNLKRTWTGAGLQWLSLPDDYRLRQATQVKNIWVPYGA